MRALLFRFLRAWREFVRPADAWLPDPPSHRLPNHGAVYIDFATGDRWQYDAPRGRWKALAIDGSPS